MAEIDHAALRVFADRDAQTALVARKGKDH
jgi:hypothetical protein